ncbi:ABC transporter ATP-binding protein [uncultured Microbacterium sp.]|uniref:energy-coupling factor ABC transporter ATP-binding protein n=1 Tax=uncultured Microbacterium sp. TaxID=191216 RepID=UPI0028DD0163|nr:ABC transporter ATP-binding protein [uncultured Microbacterium sp.]
MSGVPTLDLADVDVLRSGVAVLSGVTLRSEARTIAVIGENGSGKSTLARMLSGLVTHTRGTARVLGLDPQQDASALRRRVATVFSNPDTQIVMPTVAEDVAFSLRALRLPRAEVSTRVDAALARFGLSPLRDAAAHELSSGQKQLLAVAGAFVRDPDLVIADEPTSFLDARHARTVADHLLADQGHRTLVVTHDLALAQRCEAAVLCEGGRVVQVGDPAAVVNAYEASLGC